MRIRIQIGAVLLAVTFLATFLSILLGCYPIEKHWQINPDPGSKEFLSLAVRGDNDLSRSLSTRGLKASSCCLDHIEHINGLLPHVGTIARESDRNPKV